jgi:SAM-dependent methyltransferase
MHRSVHDGSTPNRWLTEAAPVDGIVIDLACGDGPLATLLGHRWVGVDRSEAELVAAAGTVKSKCAVRADATALPFRAAAANGLVCSMALQVLQPLDAVAFEMARTVKPGGCIVALIPWRAPLTFRDRWRYLRLMHTVRDPLAAPNDEQLASRAWASSQPSLHRVSDDARRFEYRIGTAADADRFVSSLYLQGTSDRRIAAAKRLTRQ